MYRKSLDGIRAFCIIFTIFNHIRTTPPYVIGNFGVDIFFALSGFLITFLLLSEEDRNGKIDLRSFYIRRVFRIIPLYLISVLLYFLASRVSGSSKSNDFFNSLPYLLTMNREYTGAEGVFGHAWTLGVEEKFYIIWPAALFLITLTHRYIAVLLGCVAIAAGLCLLSPISGHILRGYLGLSFGAAMAVATLRVESVRNVFVQGAWAIHAIGGMAACYIALLFTHSMIFNLAIGACGAVLVGSLWYNENQWVSRVLGATPISYFGRLTYSMYLTHVLIINAVLLILDKIKIAPQFVLVFILTYIATALLSAALHAFVEVPLINIGRRIAKRTSYNQLVKSDPAAP